MAAQQIFAREFDKIFFGLPPQIQKQIESKIDEVSLRLDKFPHHRMKGSDAFRLRAGSYRIIYQFDPAQNQIFLFTLGHRREIYR